MIEASSQQHDGCTDKACEGELPSSSQSPDRSTNDPVLIAHHLHCPNCGYDWFLSSPSCCPECGLPNAEGLLDEYKLGRLPAPLEYPRKTYLRYVQALSASARQLQRLARGFPGSPAKKWERLLRWTIWPLYTVSAMIQKAFEFANGSFMLPTGQGLVFPSGENWRSALPWLAVYASTIVLSLIIIPRLAFRPLRHDNECKRIDAFRVYAYTLPRLAAVFLAWEAHYVTVYATGDMETGLGIWLLLLLLLVAAWRRALASAITGVSSRDVISEKQAIKLAEKCMINTVAVALVCWLASVIVSYVVLNLPLPG